MVVGAGSIVVAKDRVNCEDDLERCVKELELDAKRHLDRGIDAAIVMLWYESEENES